MIKEAEIVPNFNFGDFLGLCRFGNMYLLNLNPPFIRLRKLIKFNGILSTLN